MPLVPSAAGWECEHRDTVRISDGQHFRVGSKCRVNCLPGYSLTVINEIERIVFGKQVKSFGYSNPKYLQCSEQGSWEPSDYLEQIACTISSCPTLPKPEFGTVFPEVCLSNNVPLHTQCLILCSTGHYPKNGRLRTCSKGFKWHPEDNTLCIPLPSTPRPYISCPSDVRVDLMPGLASAYVKIPQPQANMDWYR